MTALRTFNAFIILWLFLFNTLSPGQLTRDETDNVEELRRLADDGNPAAMVVLGTRYCEGRGVIKDELGGLAWFETARLLVGENEWQRSGVKRTEKFYKEMPASLLEKANAEALSKIAQIKSLGKNLSSPSTTLVAALDYVGSGELADQIKGLAFLYTASNRFNANDNTGMRDWANGLIQHTEQQIGKEAAVKAQGYASRLARINSDSKAVGNWHFDKAARANYLAVIRVFDAEDSDREEKRLLQQDEEYKKFFADTEESSSVPVVSENSFLDSVRDFFR